MAGHPGVKRMIKEMTKKYDWPGMEEDIKKYVEGCQGCQQNKPDRQKRKAPLNPLPIALSPLERISVDLIGPLPESLGYDAIMVVVDYLTKMKVLIPTTVKLTALGAAELFKAYVFKRFGLPKGVISDRGPQFVAEFIKELWKSLRIKGLPSTAYHPQTDGQTEWVNQELEIYLRFYINYQQDDWAKWIDQAEFVLNNRFHEAIQATPFFIMHGFHPWTGEQEGFSQKSPSATQWKKDLDQARENTKSALTKASESMKWFYDKRKGTPIDYKEGEMVWLDAQNLKMYWPSKKLNQKKLEPFKILEKIGHGSYRLQLPKSWNQIHSVFNEVLLLPHHPPQYPSQSINQEGYPEYEIEEILVSRKRGRGIQYLVKWEGYGNEENTWEPRGNLDDAKEVISEFHNRYLDAVRRLIQIMECQTQPLTLALGKLKGVFETKTDIRKGYCQDLLPIERINHIGGKVMCIMETTEGSNRGLSKDHSRIEEVWDEDLEG